MCYHETIMCRSVKGCVLSMKKHAWLLMVPVFLAGVYTSSVDASWLSKQLEKLDKISQSTITTDSNGTMTYPAQTNR